MLSGASLATPGRARAFVRRHSTAWGVSAAVVSSLELIVSELATNAVRHTRSRHIKLRLTLSKGKVTVAVTDSGPRHPLQSSAPEDESEHGRGLFLVEALSDSWGHEAHGDGSRVWAAIRAR
ncbi:ATP-binding protein [Streptomyces albus]|uniref:ATP-binding protein n=1 Tax=Streptomyces albus TaxID=1888 RepID=UPI002446763B|nr:ATP-binding protein [Streptomyces albus]